MLSAPRRFRLTTIFWGISLIICLLVTGLVAQSAYAHSEIVLAVHPFLPFDELQDRFAPLAEYLTERLDHVVTVKVGVDYDEYLQAIGNGQVALAFIGPAGYVSLTERFGSFPILARIETGGRPSFRGHIIVGRNAPFESLIDLADRPLAFVDPQSTMYQVPHAMLRQAGLTNQQLAGISFLGSHHNVALGVLAGDFDAGAVKEEVFLAMKDQGLRSLAPTPDIPEHLFLAAKDLDPKLVDDLRRLLLALGEDPAGDRILRSIKRSITGISPARDQDYDHLRHLRDLDSGGRP